MASITSTTKLDIYEFGLQLIDTLDLDPVYVVLHEARLEPSQLYRWLLSYWCFYSVGTASWAIDQKDYWVAMETAAGSKEYPRCHERRHFRGASAINSVAWLKERGIKNLFQPLIKPMADLVDVMKYTKTWKQFGPWISFKVADMLERLGISKIKFDTGSMFLFDSPKKGAAELWEVEGRPEIGRDRQGDWAVGKILDGLGHLKAPPRYERLTNVQEAETVLCKWHSYRGGHYQIGEDIKATRNGLLRFAKCATAQRLLKAGKTGGLW